MSAERHQRRRGRRDLLAVGEQIRPLDIVDVVSIETQEPPLRHPVDQENEGGDDRHATDDTADDAPRLCGVGRARVVLDGDD
jgi:hypothetical protein